MSIHYTRRTILLILVWILLLIIVSCATLYYGYARSIEAVNKTIESSLLKVDGSLETLITNEKKTREYYSQEKQLMGEMVPFLQEHDLEEAVPEKKHLEKYADLLGANYIAVLDAEGKTAVSSGKRVKDKYDTEITSDEEMLAWMTSANALVPADEDYTSVTVPLKDGYTLEYQISNEKDDTIQDSTFSWRTILTDIVLPDDAYFVVVSQQDDTILVHPDEEKVGKSYEALGFQSKEQFLNAYQKPDSEGIAYQEGLLSIVLKASSPEKLFKSDINLLGKGSGYKEMQGMYVICNIPMAVSVFYVVQQRGILIIYALASLLVLCYILFRFRWQRRREEMGEDQDDAEERVVKSRFGFLYDRIGSRRLIICCVIILALSAVMATHVEVLSNSAQMRIQSSQKEKQTKEVSRQNEEKRIMLDSWYNETNARMAGVLAYVVTRDDSLQTRDTMKELAERFNVMEIYLFDQNGKTHVTNADFDHIDLNNSQFPRMSQTFQPLLYGIPWNGSTPVTESLKDIDEKQEKDAKSAEAVGSGAEGASASGLFDENFLAYAGVSIRNEKDLCSGALGIVVIPMQELWGEENFLDLSKSTFDEAIEMASGTAVSEDILISANQLAMIFIMLLHLLICMILFFVLGTLYRKPVKGRSPAGVPEEASDGSRPISPDESMKPAADESMESATDGSTLTFDNINFSADDMDDHDDLFYSIYGRRQDWFFNDRWHYDNTPLRHRSPEKQLFFVIRCILNILFLCILYVFLSRGSMLPDNSMIRDVLSGGWEHGFNLYAITATEMIIISALVLCMWMRRLIYNIARFSTARGETVCHLVYSMITYAAVLVAIYYSLSLFGVHTRTILAGAGILGIVISFGAQSTIADILSGMFLIFEDVIHVGDFVKVGDTMGNVKSIGVRMTKIQSFGTEISINNADLKAMNNMSSADARVSCLLAIDNMEDLDRVERVIVRELPGINRRINETGYMTGDFQYRNVSSMDSTGMVLRFDGYCIPYRFGRVQRRMNSELIHMCQRNDICLARSYTLMEPIIEPAADTDETCRKADRIT